ncbi:hypothetical protein TNCV_2814041 [Trichonephila clavipes]|nr:hypothetical protein TNCV_2814041 [Trichonephila clavipes]
MISIPVPLKTRRVGQQCTLNLSRAETSSSWCGVIVRREGVPAQFSRAWDHSKRRHRWVSVKGSSRNGHRDSKCPSARRICMVQEDTRAPSEGATCT